MTNWSLVSPLRELTAVVQATGVGDYQRPITVMNRTDDLGELAQAIANAREQTQSLLNDLQARIDARVRDLQATQEVSRFAATQRETQALMDKVVDLITQVSRIFIMRKSFCWMMKNEMRCYVPAQAMPDVPF